MPVNFKNIKTTQGREYDERRIQQLNDSLQYLPIKQRASVLASIIEESGGNPLAKSSTEKYQGLLQWGRDRYAISSDNPDEELASQVEYMRNTFNNTTDRKSWTNGGKGSGYNSLNDAYGQFDDQSLPLSSILRGFSYGYVRPEGKEASYNNRLKVASQVYDRIDDYEKHKMGPAPADNTPFKEPSIKKALENMKAKGGKLDFLKPETAWDLLSLPAKAEMMRVAIANGIFNLNDIKKRYNEFAEGGYMDDEYATPSQQMYRPYILTESENTPTAGYTPWGMTVAADRQGNDWNFTMPDVTVTPLQIDLASNISRGRNSVARDIIDPLTEALRWMPVTGDTMDAINVYDTARQGNYSAAAGLAGLMMLPNFIEKPLKGMINKGKRFLRYLNPTVDVPKLTDTYIGRSIGNAYQYKASPEYKELVRKAIKESEDLGIGGFNERLFTQTHEELPKIMKIDNPIKDPGLYNYKSNVLTINMNNADGYEVPFHEGLHWQWIGKPYVGPKFQKWRKTVEDNMPLEIQTKYFKNVLDSPENAIMDGRSNAYIYLDKKINDVLVPDVKADDYLWGPGELSANAFESGRAIGLKPFEKQPKGLVGMIRQHNAIKNAKKYNPYLEKVKSSTAEEKRNFWNLLTGQYMPAVIPVAIGSTLISQFPQSEE